MNSRIEELKTMPYAEYLETPEWAEKRAKALQQAGYRCQICNSPDSLHVHHRTYENKGDERPGDLTVLCENCHTLYHYKDSLSLHSVLSIQESLDQVFDHVEYYSATQGGPGIGTGFADLDILLGGGLQKGHLIVVAGRPSIGKSAFAVTLVLNAAMHGARCLFFSLKMDHLQLAHRMLAILTGIPVLNIQQGQISENAWEGLFNASGQLGTRSIAIDDTPAPTVRQIRHRSLEHKAQHGLDYVIVDGLQLMSDDEPSRDRFQHMPQRTKALKNLARELDVPVVLTSQVGSSVENRSDKRPMLRDLHEFGSIDADADVVLFIYRDEMYEPDTEFPNIAEIGVAKNRDGPTGRFAIYFKKELTQFLDLEKSGKSLGY